MTTPPPDDESGETQSFSRRDTKNSLEASQLRQINKIVERERLRSKRVFFIFSALLLVPVALGVGAIISGQFIKEMNKEVTEANERVNRVTADLEQIRTSQRESDEKLAAEIDDFQKRLDDLNSEFSRLTDSISKRRLKSSLRRSVRQMVTADNIRQAVIQADKSLARLERRAAISRSHP